MKPETARDITLELRNTPDISDDTLERIAEEFTSWERQDGTYRSAEVCVLTRALTSQPQVVAEIIDVLAPPNGHRSAVIRRDTLGEFVRLMVVKPFVADDLKLMAAIELSQASLSPSIAARTNEVMRQQPSTTPKHTPERSDQSSETRLGASEHEHNQAVSARMAAQQAAGQPGWSELLTLQREFELSDQEIARSLDIGSFRVSVRRREDGARQHPRLNAASAQRLALLGTLLADLSERGVPPQEAADLVFRSIPSGSLSAAELVRRRLFGEAKELVMKTARYRYPSPAG